MVGFRCDGDSSKTILSLDGKTIPCGKTGERWYFLEEMYPALGPLVPRDIAARELLHVCELGLGVKGRSQVYLDMTHLHPEKLHKVELVLEIYHKFTGDDSAKVPMKIFPAVHRLHSELSDWMIQHATVKRNNTDLQKIIMRGGLISPMIG